MASFFHFKHPMVIYLNYCGSGQSLDIAGSLCCGHGRMVWNRDVSGPNWYSDTTERTFWRYTFIPILKVSFFHFCLSPCHIPLSSPFWFSTIIFYLFFLHSDFYLKRRDSDTIHIGNKLSINFLFKPLLPSFGHDFLSFEESTYTRNKQFLWFISGCMRGKCEFEVRFWNRKKRKGSRNELTKSKFSVQRVVQMNHPCP